MDHFENLSTYPLWYLGENLTVGTNYYDQKGLIHVGRRDQAGLYCWDCHVTLCKKGERHVLSPDALWYDHCPQCGALPSPGVSLYQEHIKISTSFNHDAIVPRRGVSQCSCFTWAVEPAFLDRGKRKFIKDEYGERFRISQFRAILAGCPLQFHHLIGKVFA